jgi:hypothetical protein
MKISKRKLKNWNKIFNSKMRSICLWKNHQSHRINDKRMHLKANYNNSNPQE